MNGTPVDGWRLDGAGLQSIIDNVRPHAAAIRTATSPESMQAVVDGVSLGGQYTMSVQAALAMLYTDQMENTKTISWRVTAGASGVANAARALDAGNAEMRDGFQREMLESATDGDFSYFEANGYR